MRLKMINRTHRYDINRPRPRNKKYTRNKGVAVNSRKKREDSLQTRAALLIFLLELETSGVAVQRLHQKNEKR